MVHLRSFTSLGLYDVFKSSGSQKQDQKHNKKSKTCQNHLRDGEGFSRHLRRHRSWIHNSTCPLAFPQQHHVTSGKSKSCGSQDKSISYRTTSRAVSGDANTYWQDSGVWVSSSSRLLKEKNIYHTVSTTEKKPIKLSWAEGTAALSTTIRKYLSLGVFMLLSSCNTQARQVDC